MGTRNQDGFTIIETLLFLAVTGLLIVVLLAGVGSSLNVQRYRDSVESFKSLLQEQYTSLSSVQNGRSDEWSCDATPTITDEDDGESRGQSECLLVGKYLRIESNAISVYPVLAYQNSSNHINDIDAMTQDYAMNASVTEVEEERLEWGAEIAWAKEGDLDRQNNPTPRSMGILFIRSPYSGQVYTFTSDTIPEKEDISPAILRAMIVGQEDVPGQGERMICIDSGAFFVEGNIGVYMTSYASNGSSIETRTNDNPISIDRGIEC